MRTVTLGRSGLTVSRIGFGGIPIQRLNEHDAVTVIQRCLELGITLIDTANAYTVSEGHIGRAISGYPREKLIIATKTMARSYEKARDHIRLSLKQLRTDYIDIYQLHAVSNRATLDEVMSSNGAFAALHEARRAGIVRHLGITSHNPDTAKAAVQLGPFETMMYPFNFVAHEPGEEVLAVCREQDAGFMAMKPMGGGLLQNATLAFKFLLNILGVVPVVGIEKPVEIEEIVSIEERAEQLTEQDMAQIEQIRRELGPHFCRRCDYCQPCPEGIPISTINNLASFIKRGNPIRIFGPGMLANAVEKALHCTECGECEQRCPYNLPILEIRKENLRLYEEAKAGYERELATRR